MLTHPSVKCTLLFALDTSLGRPVSLVVGGASLTFAPNKSSGELANLTPRGFPVFCDIFLAFFADGTGLTRAENKRRVLFPVSF